MSSIFSSTHMHTHREFLEHDGKAATWGDSIRNLLFGRVLANWKENILAGASVFYICKAAISFFSGYWILAIIELSTGGFMGILRKEIRDFTNLHKATGEIQKQNNVHLLANLQLKETVEDFVTANEEFKAEVVKLQEESQKFADSNFDYAKHNEVHKQLLKTMDDQIGKSAKSIKSALASGSEISRQILDEFLTAADTFSQQKKTLKDIQHELQEEHEEAFKRLKRLTVEVGKMDARGAKSLRLANEELQKTQQEIVASTEKLAGLNEQIEILEEQIERLQGVVKELEKAAKTNTETAQIAQDATKRVHSASNNLGMVFKGIIGYTDPNSGEFSPGFDKAFGIVVAASLIYKYIHA